MEDRRAFLRGLVSLPLIGGSVALIGQTGRCRRARYGRPAVCLQNLAAL